MLAMMLVAVDVLASGILMSLRDFAYLARAFVLTFGALGVFVVVGVKGQGWGLEGVWWGLVFFFGARAIQSLFRLNLMLREYFQGGPDGTDEGKRPGLQPGGFAK
jgi:hypothetical protein